MLSRVRLCDPMDCSLPASSVHGIFQAIVCPWDFPGNSTEVDCHFLLQGIFPTQGSNPGLPHCRQTLYRLSHQGSLEGWRQSSEGRSRPLAVTSEVQQGTRCRAWGRRAVSQNRQLSGTDGRGVGKDAPKSNPWVFCLCHCASRHSDLRGGAPSASLPGYSHPELDFLPADLHGALGCAFPLKITRGQQRALVRQA